jgi:hypothetical protein
VCQFIAVISLSLLYNYNSKTSIKGSGTNASHKRTQKAERSVAFCDPSLWHCSSKPLRGRKTHPKFSPVKLNPDKLQIFSIFFHTVLNWTPIQYNLQRKGEWYDKHRKMSGSCACGFLPQAQVSEFRPFIQINFGNPHTIGELISLRSHEYQRIHFENNF